MICPSAEISCPVTGTVRYGTVRFGTALENEIKKTSSVIDEVTRSNRIRQWDLYWVIDWEREHAAVCVVVCVCGVCVCVVCVCGCVWCVCVGG